MTLGAEVSERERKRKREAERYPALWRLTQQLLQHNSTIVHTIGMRLRYTKLSSSSRFFSLSRSTSNIHCSC